MANESIKIISKYILIIGIVLCLVSFILPWGESNSVLGDYNFYCWGVNSKSYITDNVSIAPYFFFVDSDIINDFFGLNDIEYNIFAFVFGLLIIFLWFVVLLFGLTSLKEVLKNKYYGFDELYGGIFGIVTVAFFYIFIEFGISSLGFSLNKPLNFEYSIGLYVMIISSILLLLTFIIKYELLKEDDENKKLNKKALDLLNERYVKGEISKKEYNEKKEDILDWLIYFIVYFLLVW